MENTATKYFEGGKSYTEVSTSEKRKKLGRIFLIVAAVTLIIALVFAVTRDIPFKFQMRIFFNRFLFWSLPFWVLFFIFRLGKVKQTIKEDDMPGSEYDAFVIDIVKRKANDPREYLGIDSSEIEEIEPISFDGYNLDDCMKWKRDSADNYIRTDLYEKVVLFFTANEIHVYKCNVNTITERITESTSVYFYEDVVSVSTEQRRSAKIENSEYLSFKLETRGNASISVALKGDAVNQRSINAMRSLIKEKKS